MKTKATWTNQPLKTTKSSLEERARLVVTLWPEKEVPQIGSKFLREVRLKSAGKAIS